MNNTLCACNTVAGEIMVPCKVYTSQTSHKFGSKYTIVKTPLKYLLPVDGWVHVCAQVRCSGQPLNIFEKYARGSDPALAAGWGRGGKDTDTIHSAHTRKAGCIGSAPDKQPVCQQHNITSTKTHNTASPGVMCKPYHDWIELRELQLITHN